MSKSNRGIAAAACAVLCALALFSLTGCGEKVDEGEYQRNPALDISKEVQLRIGSNKETWPEMDVVIAKFEEIYPNCSITCEYIEEFTKTLNLRLEQDEQKIDIFRTTNIQENTDYRDKALNLISDEAKQYLDLSDTNEGIVKNFKYIGEENVQYAIPYGGEMRGMYVNTTLLDKYELEVPTNRAELLYCCKVLHEAGYVPLQSNNGTFAQQLLYPYICNSIVNGGNYEQMYAAIENIDEGVSEYFRDAYAFLYDIVEKRYYDYKRVEEDIGYTFDGSAGKAKDFLNIRKVSAEEYEKKDDVGEIAFMVDTQGFGLELAKTKSDYHSEIEYQFILSPVGEYGGCAYLSPADGLAVNNRSDNIEWALEFLNFFFTHDVNTEFARESGKISNTYDALVQYEVPSDRVCDVGQVTFSYTFYKTVTTLMMGGYEDMIGISKMNAEKYMQDNGDGTYSIMYTLDDYMERLEAEFMAIKLERQS